MAENITDVSGGSATPFPVGETFIFTIEDSGGISKIQGSVVSYDASSGHVTINKGGQTIIINTHSPRFIKAVTKKTEK